MLSAVERAARYVIQCVLRPRLKYYIYVKHPAARLLVTEMGDKLVNEQRYRGVSYRHVTGLQLTFTLVGGTAQLVNNHAKLASRRGAPPASTMNVPQTAGAFGRTPDAAETKGARILDISVRC